MKVYGIINSIFALKISPSCAAIVCQLISPEAWPLEMPFEADTGSPGLSQWKWRVELEEKERRGKPRLNSSVAKSLWIGCLFCLSRAANPEKHTHGVQMWAIQLCRRTWAKDICLRHSEKHDTWSPVFQQWAFVRTRMCLVCVKTTMKSLSYLECDLPTSDTLVQI